MDVLQKEIDEVYATQLIADEILDNGVVEQHQRFIHSLTEINGGCAVISDLSNRKSYIAVHLIQTLCHRRSCYCHKGY